MASKLPAIRLSSLLLALSTLTAQVTPKWIAPPSYTAATLPIFGVRNRIVFVTDAASVSSCIVGGGSTVVLCRDTGLAWEPTGDGTGGGGGGSGTVTSVSVVTANGVSGSVATSTTTPAITLALGAITPSSVASAGSVTGSNLSGTNTGDQTNIPGNAATANALAADPSDCSADQPSIGINASGTANCSTLTAAVVKMGSGVMSAATPGTDYVTPAGSVASLTTPRSIYGNNFNGTADLGQVIASTFGGTGNGFAKIVGPATSEKEFTLPNASATILTTNAAVTVLQGGTGATTAPTARTNLGIGTGGNISCGNVNFSASTLAYCANFATFGSTEAARQEIIYATGTLATVYIVTGTTAPGADLTCNVRINGATIASSTIAFTGYVGPKLTTITVNSAVTAGNRLAVSCLPGAGTQTSWIGWSYWMTY